MKHFLISAMFVVLLILVGGLGNCSILRVPSTYPNIQAGINAASDGDTVLVADGTYMDTGNKNIDFNAKRILLTSEHGANWCFIDCLGSGRAFIFHNNEDNNSIVSGFTIRNGLVIDGYGSGILISYSSPSIVNCIISDCGSINPCPKGGGIALVGSSESVIFNCILIGCNAIEAGGGIYCEHSNPLLVNCTISNNSANQGSGFYCDGSSPEIRNTIFWFNAYNYEGFELYIGTVQNPSFLVMTYSDCSDEPNAISIQPNCSLTGNHNIHADPEFITGPYGAYYLTQPTAENLRTSPCVNTGSEMASQVCHNLAESASLKLLRLFTTCMNQHTTRIDSVPDGSTVDMGFHYAIPATPTPTYTHTPPLTRTPSPTRTVTPTRTPTPFYTHDPNETPTIEPSPTDSPLPSQTEIQTPTNTPTPITGTTTPFASRTPIPTPTPGDGTGVFLYLSASYFEPGDLFYLKAYLANRESYAKEVSFWLVLDVYGAFFCYPSWGFPDYLDMTVTPDYYEEREILNFAWPYDCEGSASGIYFVSGFTYAEEQEIYIFGNYSLIYFSYDCYY